AMGARLEHDEGKDRDLAGFQSHRLREGLHHLHLQVLADAFLVIKRAVLAPDLPRLPGDAPVGGKVLLRHWQQNAVDIGHPISPLGFMTMAGVPPCEQMVQPRTMSRAAPPPRCDGAMKRRAIRATIARPLRVANRRVADRRVADGGEGGPRCWSIASLTGRAGNSPICRCSGSANI